MWRNRGMGLLLAGLALTATVNAQEVKTVHREGTVEVLGQVGRALEVVVPAGVSSLVRTGAAASIKVEHVAGHLFITPLMTDAAELVVMDTFGRSYRLKFVFDKGFDEKIVILEMKAAAGDGGTLVSIDLLRDMAAGRIPSGAVERRLEELVFADDKVRIKTVMIYEMPEVVGYVLTAENLLPQPLVVPVEQFSFPGLLAVSSQQDILAPTGSDGAQGTLYMVATR